MGEPRPSANMAPHPTYIDTRSVSRATTASDYGLPSPRLHVAGDLTPALSPLDAFAAQSRLLAKQLSESANDQGKRMSRLPPLALETALHTRHDYFRSHPSEPPLRSTTSFSPGSGPPLTKAEVEEPGFRPVSVHPLLSGFLPPVQQRSDPKPEEARGRHLASIGETDGFFGARRDHSPASFDLEYSRPRTAGQASNRPSNESLRQGGLVGRRQEYRALAPPRSPYQTRTPSSRSIASVESSDRSDEDAASVNAPTAFSPQKHRPGSAVSTAANSPAMIPSSIPRSPSACSEASTNGMRLRGPAFNFSRPISRQSTAGSMLGTSLDMPSRQTSSDSQPSIVFDGDTAHTPVSMHSEDFLAFSKGEPPVEEPTPAPSYVYSRFALPRGKALLRNSLLFQEPSSFPGEASRHPIDGVPPPSPPSRPSTSSLQSEPCHLDGPVAPPLAPPPLVRAATSHGEVSTITPKPSAAPTAHSYSASVSSASTIKPPKTMAPTAEWSADEHVSRAIEFHESGALTKSTYHLRLAARQNHPTGMLLYALACRHGWGMRPNQKEGVSWLRKAMDSAGLEIADDENQAKDGKVVDILESKARKAQFALAIYELGVSHLNGWGIEQDRGLALRCFEIAGSWGDGDALAEAGYCYAQGVGCKKDLKKSAKFYRQAEAKGISMVGNSWIYKQKYNDTETSPPPAQHSVATTTFATLRTTKSGTEREAAPEREKEKDKKKEEKVGRKSRSKSLFGRKRPDITIPLAP